MKPEYSLEVCLGMQCAQLHWQQVILTKGLLLVITNLTPVMGWKSSHLHTIFIRHFKHVLVHVFSVLVSWNTFNWKLGTCPMYFIKGGWFTFNCVIFLQICVNTGLSWPIELIYVYAAHPSPKYHRRRRYVLMPSCTCMWNNLWAQAKQRKEGESLLKWPVFSTTLHKLLISLSVIIKWCFPCMKLQG